MEIVIALFLLFFALFIIIVVIAVWSTVFSIIHDLFKRSKAWNRRTSTRP